MTESRKVRFKASFWDFEETEDNELLIHVGGRTSTDESVHCIIHSFTPFVYLELPKRIKWNKGKCQSLYEYLRKVMKVEGPLEYKMQQKYKLYEEELCNVLRFTFKTQKACQSLESKCMSKKGFAVDGVGYFRSGELIVHERNVDPIIKFTALKSIKLASWMEVTETVQPEDEGLDQDERKFSSADIDMHVEWTDVNPVDAPPGAEGIVSFTYDSFDIETYSVNHNSKLPDPDIPGNFIIQIGNTSGCFGTPKDSRERVIFTLFNPHPIEGVKIVRCANEKEVILKWRDYVNDTNPDVFLGYNIMKFDWNYLIKRAEFLGIYLKFAQISRIIGRKAEIKELKWKSSAYQEQIFRYLNAHGRVNADVIIEIERNFRLSNYTLNTVANFLLKQQKDDITPRQLFMLVQLTMELSEEINGMEDGVIERNARVALKKKIQKILEMRRCHGIVRSLRDELMAAKTGKQFKKLIRDPITLITKYCMQDTSLVVDIAEKLNLWTTMEGLSDCMNVPNSYLHTRGQQVKVLAQVYRETIFNDIIIPYKQKHKEGDPVEKFQGATVIEANPGDYDNVICLDFESLYPSIMIFFNICPSTYVRPDRTDVPDSECHLIPISEHVGCIAKGSRVSLMNHSRKIETMNSLYDVVLGWDEKKGGLLRSEQTNFFKQGVKECVRLTLEDGSTLECTPDHKILTDAGEWIRADEVEMDTRIKTGYLPPMFDMNSETFELAGEIYQGDSLRKLMHLFGLLCTDGYVTKGRCNVYVGHTLDIESVQHDMLDLFGERVEPRKQNYGWAFTIPGKYGIAMREIEGLMKGKKTTQKRTLPVFVNTLGDGALAAFLSGLFGGDGHTFTFSKSAACFGPLAFSWTSDNESFLTPVFEQLQSLLKKLGVDSTFGYRSNEMKLSITSNSTLTFREKIGFAHCVHKSARLDAVCRYLSMRDKVWEQQKWIVNRAKELKSANVKLSFTTVTKQAVQELHETQYIYNSYYANPTGQQVYHYTLQQKGIKPMFSRKHFPGPIEYMEQIGAEHMFFGKYGVEEGATVVPTFNIKVIGFEYIGKRETFDLEVEFVHSFLANGIVVHNCTHDPLKRKKKKADILCNECVHRFYKVITHPDGTREREGLFPRLERKLLGQRKIVKGVMGKLEAKLKTHEGKASEDDMAAFKKKEWETVEKGSLPEKEVVVLKSDIAVKNANQLALKVSANSMYGTLGAVTGALTHIPGAASVTGRGRFLIGKAIEFVLSRYPGVMDGAGEMIGKAKLVYGDTDSSMLTFIGKTTAESFELGDKISKEVSHYLKTYLLGFDEEYMIECPSENVKYRIDKYPRSKIGELEDEQKIHIHQYDSNPINLAFENLYKRYILLSKKRYMAHAVNRKGEIIQTIKKGVCLSRRDNSQYLRDTYKDITDNILECKTEQEAMYKLYDRVNKLFTRQIPDANLIIYTGVKTVINYAKKQKEVEGKKKSKAGNSDIVFVDSEGEPITDILGPLDPRLVYPNLPQVLLSLKMIRRGDDVPPNTRLEYLYLETPGAIHQGEKAEDYTFYRENKQEFAFKPDYLHYIEKQLCKPVTELLTVKYPKPAVIFEKIDDALNRCIEGLDELNRHRVMELKTYSRTVEEWWYDSYTVGWNTKWCKKCRGIDSERCAKHAPKTKPFTYSYKSNAAKVQYILDSIAARLENPKAPNTINPEKYPELYQVCLRWKSRNIIDRLHTQYGLRKRTVRKPPQVSERLRLSTKERGPTKVLLARPYKTKVDGKKVEYPRDTMATLMERTDIEIENAKGKKVKTATYSIKMIDGNVLKDVPRDAFNTFYRKESNLMDQILLARGTFKTVIEEINKLFSPVTFNGDTSAVRVYQLKTEEGMAEEEDES